MQFTIPLNPVTKKNSQQIIGIGKMCPVCKRKAKAVIVPSKKYKEYEVECEYFMPKIKEPICEPVNVKAAYYMETKRMVDLTNLNEALHDVLVHYGILADDNRNIVYSTDGSRVLWDKENPRTEITIEPINEDMEWWGKKERK